jgi:UDP-N-acetylmuramoylalanine--D-glutamate ligase
MGAQKENHVYRKLPLRGRHNAMNISAAILAAMRVGMEKHQIEEGLASFKGVPHRLEEVANVHGIRFINDSKATNVDAVSYALDAFEKSVIWIAGGIDKGNDYSLLQDLVKQKVKGIVCLGLDNHKLIKAFGETVTFIYETKRMEEAVQTAYHLADEGDVVLLSPACASFDLFRNYEDRGDQFRETVLRNYVQKRAQNDKDFKTL